MGLITGRARWRTRSHAAWLALACLLGALLVVAAPGVAAANPNRSQPPDVVPLVDCIVRHADGTWTAVFGYDNRTGTTVTIPVGPANRVTPTSSGAPQPTVFQPGVRHGVFTVLVTRGGGPMWHLGSTNLAARKADAPCPEATEMPADGNGSGDVIALAAAGVVGVWALRRPFRRPADGLGTTSRTSRWAGQGW